ncbi:hypothetical protein HMPREF1393_00511 [Helicobacter pylori GAM103Bi]|nr:hypothetical protein HMPREF1393_00511 [Helicobacter pylori GAM103Bi]
MGSKKFIKIPCNSLIKNYPCFVFYSGFLTERRACFDSFSLQRKLFGAFI